MGEFFEMIGGWPMWVKLLALLVALGLILLIWQPWNSSSSSSSSSGSGGGLFSVSPGAPPPAGPPGPPPGSPSSPSSPSLPSQVLQGSGYWVGQAEAASTPITTQEGTFQWIAQPQFKALTQENQPIFYEPLPGDFVQLPYSSPGHLNIAGLQGQTPLYAEEPSQANAQAA